MGIATLVAGFGLVLRPVATLGEAVPILGSLVAGGTMVAALVLTAALAPIAIGLAWLAYAPAFSIMVIGCGIAGVLALLAVVDLLRGRATAAAR